MSTDRELLELAAKAAGYDVTIVGAGEHAYGLMNYGAYRPTWNPLTDDGDALRLAVKLEMILSLIQHDIFDPEPDDPLVIVATDHDRKDPYAATRRAIVRAAAAIGATK